MADSAQYTPDTVARRVKIAQQLLDQSKPQPIVHWAQGLNELAQGALGGYMLNKAEGQEREGRTDALNAAINAFGGSGGSTGAPASIPSTPAPPSIPQDALSGAPMAGNSSPMSGGTLASNDMASPRGFRNNNPLNIEAGGFTQSQPGFQGSDGRFAQFGSMDQGIGAADALLQSYGKRGINTVGGIVNRWAPPSDNNPTNTYAATVAKALGADPNTPLDMTDPNVRKSLIGAMAQFENGKPLQTASAAGPMAFAPPSPQANPLSAPNGAGAPAPQPGGFDASAALPASVTTPAVRNVTGALNGTPQAPAAASPAPAQGGQTNRAAIIAAMLNPWTPPGMQAVLAARMQPPEFKTITDITGAQRPVWVNPNDQSVTSAGVGGGAGGASGAASASGDPEDVAKAFEKEAPGVNNRVEQLYNGEGGMLNKRTNPLDAAAAQLIALKHPDWNMTMWTAKNKMQQGLSSGQPSSLGGRLQALRNAFDHLANTSDSAVEKGNVDAGLSPISYVANKVKSMTTGQQDISNKLQREAVTYGGERTKFLTGSEGSESERRAFLDSLGPDTAAPPQMAGTIEGEYTQLKSALLNQEQQIREQLGDKYLEKKPIITPEVKASLSRIEKNIVKLRGGAAGQTAGAAVPQAPSAPLKAGNYRFNPASGQLEPQ